MFTYGIFRAGGIRSSAVFQRRLLSNYFELFPKTFTDKKPVWLVDQVKLRKEYRSLQAQFHPDVVKNESNEDQSSLLNKAYHILKSPLTRSQYLIKVLDDIDLTNDKVKKQITNSDPELLMKIIDIHEELSECTEEGEVRTIEKENKSRMKDIEAQLDTAFANSDYKTAIKLTVELKYWTNLALAIKEWAPGKPIELIH
ncbi:hypothetical protein C6P45_000021 [Maudiozyma exigua]|uniref:J domain-containing protein n=1 Tax=Maudiozyma exigua TaxID=34358 RepID=A0A9P6WHQ0_MAUEX|nr:hypothetical protein C6P45_000021 [Kazachstania exigua]